MMRMHLSDELLQTVVEAPVKTARSLIGTRYWLETSIATYIAEVVDDTDPTIKAQVWARFERAGGGALPPKIRKVSRRRLENCPVVR